MANNLFFIQNTELPSGVYVASPRHDDENTLPADGSPCMFLIRNQIESDHTAKLSLKDVWKKNAPDFCFAFVPHFPANSLKRFGNDLKDLIFSKAHSSSKRIPLIAWIHQLDLNQSSKLVGGEFLHFDEWEDDDKTIDLKGLPLQNLLSIPLNIGGFKLSLGFTSKVTLENFELRFSNAAMELLDVLDNFPWETPTVDRELFKCDLVAHAPKAPDQLALNRIGFLYAQINALNLDILPINFSFYVREKPTDEISQRFDYRIFEGLSLNLGIFVHPGDLWISEFTFIERPTEVVTVPTYFRTTSNEKVSLRPHPMSRLVLNKVFKPNVQDDTLLKFPSINGIFYQFLPSGSFFVSNKAAANANWLPIVCGLAGTEFISTYSPIPHDKDKCSLLNFVVGKPAVFVGHGKDKYELVDDTLSTAYLAFDNSLEPDYKPQGGELSQSGYFVQPQDSALFENFVVSKKKKTTTNTFLTYKTVCLSKKACLPAVPMVPFAGLQLGKKGTLTKNQKVLLKQNKRLCGKVMAAHRVTTMRADKPTLFRKQRKASSRDLSLGVTPQGWLAEVTTGATNEFSSVLLCSSPVKIQVDCSTPKDFDDAWLNKDLFLVIKHLDKLKFKPPFDSATPTLNLAGWDIGLDCDYIVVKSSNKSFKDLISQAESWTQVDGLTCTPSEMQTAQEYFQTVVTSRLNSSDPEKNSLYSDLKEAIENPSWNGVLIFKPSVLPADDGGSGLGAINTLVNRKKLTEYFKDTFSALGFATSKALVEPGTSELKVKDTSVFAVVDYADAAPAESSTQSATFVLNNLSARFTNGTLAQFKADGTLELLKLFERSMNTSGSKNKVAIKGRYKKVNGKGVYSFCTEGNLGVDFGGNSILKSVGVNSIEFKSANGKSSFDFSGWLKFASGASTYFGDSQLTFDGIKLKLPEIPDSRKYLDLSFDPSELRFDLALSSLVNSFLKVFPVKYKSFFYSAASTKLSELGYLSSHTDGIRYGLVFELDMGTIGSLVSGDSVKVDLIFGWDATLGVGIRFPSWSGGNAEIGIEGVIKLVIQHFEIKHVKASSDIGAKELIAITFNECTLNLFGESYSKASIFVIVPDGGQKPAWVLSLEDAGNSEVPDKFIAAGQRLKFPELERASGARAKLNEFRKSINDDKILEVIAQNQCSNNEPSYCPERNWLVGGWLKFKGTAEVYLVFVDDTVYGGALTVPFLEALIGDGIDIAYTKISRSVGALAVDLQILSVLSKLGPFGVTVPRVGLSAYTNGGFRFDLGFPKNTDFSRSFQFSLGLLGGRGGFYYGFIHRGEASHTAISLGVGFNVYYGKGIELGIVSGRFEIGAFGIIETTFSINIGIEKFVGLVGIYGFIEGHVSLGFVSGRAKVLIEATAELNYTRGQGGYLRVGARLEGSFSITIGVGDCATTYTYDFTVKFKYTWTFGSSGQALQSRSGRHRIARKFTGLRRDYRNSELIEVPLFFAPNLVARGAFHDDWNPKLAEVKGIGIAAIMLRRPDGDSQDLALLRSNIVMRIADWILQSIHQPLNVNYTLSEISDFIEYLSKREDRAVGYTELSLFLEKNFKFKLDQQVPFKAGANFDLLQFPFPPGLRAKLSPSDQFSYSQPWIPRHIDAKSLSSLNNSCRNQIYGDIDVVELPGVADNPEHPFVDLGELIFCGYFSTVILNALSTMQTFLSRSITESNLDPSLSASNLVALFDSSLNKEAQDNADAALTVAGRILMSGKCVKVDDEHIGIYQISNIEGPVALPKDQNDPTIYSVVFEEAGHLKHDWFSYPKESGKFKIQANHMPLSEIDLQTKSLYPKRTFEIGTEVLFSGQSKYHVPCYLSQVKLADRLPEASKLRIFSGGNHVSDFFALPSRFAAQALRHSNATAIVPIPGAKFAISVPVTCSVEPAAGGKLFRLPTIPEKIRRSLDRFILSSASTEPLAVKIFAKNASGLVEITGTWTLFNTNLSIVSNPPDNAAHAAIAQPLNNCAQSTEGNNNFLDVLRRLSNVNESGYFLSTDSSSSFQTFIENDSSVDLYVLFTHSSDSSIFPGANSVITGATQSSSIIQATEEIDYLPKVPAGSLPIVMLRDKLKTPSYLQSIYSLVGYEIVDTPETPFKPEVFLMPISPQTVECDFKIPQPDTKQMFSALLPASGKLKEPVISEPLRKIANSYKSYAELANVFDPYSIVGRKITIGLKFRDICGNTIQYDDAHPSTQVTVPLKYTDRIIDLKEWPGLVCGYTFNDDGVIEILFDINLTFNKSINSAGVLESKNEVSKDYLVEIIEKYQKILWQIQKRKHDSGASMQLFLDFSMHEEAERQIDLESKLEEFIDTKVLKPLSDSFDGKPLSNLSARMKHKFSVKKNSNKKAKRVSEIQNFVLVLELRRPIDESYVDLEIAKLIPEVALSLNPISAYTEIQHEKEKSTLVLNEETFAKAVEDFYDDPIQGFKLAYLFDKTGEKLYAAIRNRFLNIEHRIDKSASFFAQKPLWNQGFTGQASGELLNNFDVDAELDFVIGKFEEMLSAKSIQTLTKNPSNSLKKVSDFINLKVDLANALSKRVSPIFQRKDAKTAAAAEIYQESLRRDLRNSFQTDCVAQIPCSYINEPYSEAEIANAGYPTLYGRVIGADGKNVDSAATKLHLIESINGFAPINFVSASSTGLKDLRRSYKLKGSYKISHVERTLDVSNLRDFARLQLNGFETRDVQRIEEVYLPQDLTQWLYLILPKDIDLHEFTLPVVYRRIPAAPVIAGDLPRTKDKEKIKKVDDAHLWSYEMQLEVASPQLDKLTLTTSLTNKLLDGQTALGVNDLVAALRTFRASWQDATTLDLDKITTQIGAIIKALLSSSYKSLSTSNEYVLSLSELPSNHDMSKLSVHKINQSSNYNVEIRVADTNNGAESEAIKLVSSERCIEADVDSLGFGFRRKYRVSYVGLPITEVNRGGLKARISRNEDLIELDRINNCPVYEMTAEEFVMHSEEVFTGRMIEPTILIDKVIYIQDLAGYGKRTFEQHIDALFKEIFDEQYHFRTQVSWYHGYEQQAIISRLDDSSDVDIEDYELTHRVPVMKCIEAKINNEEDRKRLVSDIALSMKGGAPLHTEESSLGFFQLDLTVFRDQESTNELLRLTKLRLPFDSIKF